MSASRRLVPEELARLRREAGLTQRQVAERLGKDQPYVSRYESGYRRMDVTEFIEVCCALNAEPQDVFARILALRLGLGDGAV